jgi:hypothetical protein
MTESFPEGKEGPSSVDRAYADFKAAHDEETSLMSEIDRIYKTTENRAEADRLFEEYAQLVDAMRRRADAALDEWLAGVRHIIAELDSSPRPE